MSEHHHHHHESGDRQEHVNDGHGHEHNQEHEHAHEHEGSRRSRSPLFLLGGLKRETRAGIAILFSFLVLTAVLVSNKRNHGGSADPKSAASKVAGADTKGRRPVKENEKDRPRNTAVVTAIAPRAIKQPDVPDPRTHKSTAEKSEPPITTVADNEPDRVNEADGSGAPPLVTSALPDTVNLTANSEPPRLPPLVASGNEPEKNAEPAPAPDAAPDAVLPDAAPPPLSGVSRSAPPALAGGISLPNAPATASAPSAPPPVFEQPTATRTQPGSRDYPRDPLPAPAPTSPEPAAEPSLGTGTPPPTMRLGANGDRQRSVTAGPATIPATAVAASSPPDPAPADPAPPSTLPASTLPASLTSPTATRTDEPGWITLPNVGKSTKTNPPTHPGPDSPDRLLAVNATRASAPAAATAPGDDGLDPVEHVVQSGENFWTISKLYYGSSRYYKALWAANRDRVSAPDQLRVNQAIRVPPPEALDRSLIVSSSAPDAAARAGSRTRSGRDVEVSLPVGTPSASPSRPKRRVAETTNDADLPHYQVRAHDTLRTIARDTLGDSHRSDEILEMNRDTIADPHRLTAGQTLILPEDARVGRRTR